VIQNRETGIDAESWLVHFKELNTVNKSQFHLNNKYWNALNLCKIPNCNAPIVVRFSGITSFINRKNIISGPISWVNT
jgi:hypothetical protein